MKKYYLLILGLSLVLYACDNDYFHDSGLADGKHDCSMWEYFKSQPNDWDSTMILIEHAGLKDIFDGTNPTYKEITFFGVTNLSIEQFLDKTTDDDREPLYDRVTDIPADLCREMLLSHVVAGKKLREDFDHEVRGTLTGGTILESLSGIELRVYRIKSSYNGVPDTGAESIGVHALVSGQMATVASSNIEVTNGVVHSLGYTYLFTQL